MGIWHIAADTLASGRFAVSALAETVATLVNLESRRAPPGQEDWLRSRYPAYRRRLAADPFAQQLVRAALRPRSLPDFLTMPPHAADRGFDDELSRVRRIPADQAIADLGAGMGGTPLPATLRVPELPDRTADLLNWVWTHAVLPDWPRRRQIFEADIVSRTRQLSTAGWAGALDGMRPGMRWLGDGQLRINVYDNPPRTLADAQLVFIPTTARRGWVGWELPSRYAIVYPTGGLLAGPLTAVPPHALSRLIGPVRAAVLCGLDAPRSTTQLVALTGHTLGSVGGHLKVLHDARLVDRRRSGRSVLYYRTDDGNRLVALRDPSAPDRPA